MSMKIETMKVRLTFTDVLLGSLPNNTQVYTDFLFNKKVKNAKEGQLDEELDALKKGIDERETDIENKITVFARNRNNDPCIFNYVIKGFFKNAAKALNYADPKDKMTAFKTKIDDLIFISPRLIDIKNIESIGMFERALRADTAQGPRVSLAASECINSGAYIEFEIQYLDKTLKDRIIGWLEYGKFNGLGQWHNGGNGTFEYEILE